MVFRSRKFNFWNPEPLETVNKNIYIFGIAMDEQEKKEVIDEANKIYGIEEVIPSIYLASELSRTKIN